MGELTKEIWIDAAPIDPPRRVVFTQRRALPLGGEVQLDYEFEGVEGPVRLSELFDDGKDTLFLYSFMFIPGEQGLPLEVGCPCLLYTSDAADE